MRVAIGVVLALFAVGVWVGFWLLDRADKRKYPSPGVRDAQRIALEAIRHLDQALLDPMYRQSSEWEDRAKSLVNSYYGKKGLNR